ncbi:MAG: DUF6377 domain-containing protein [Bacteroidales bacterium]
MNNVRKYLYICLLTFTCISSYASDTNKTQLALKRLDQTIDSIDFYNTRKENIISKHKQLILLEKKNYDKLFKIYGLLKDDYFKFNPDSCKKYTDLRINIARKLNNKSYIAESLIDLANWYAYVSLFSNAKQILDKVRKDLPASQKVKYYSSLSSFYYLKTSYCSLFDELKAYNLNQCYLYRDSISQNSEKENSSIYELSFADKLRMEGHYKEAIKYLTSRSKKFNPDNNLTRLYASSIAQSYEKEGQIDEAKYYYALSSISDIQNAIKETSSLWMLSSILFKEGDLIRANRYLQISLKHAIECKSRLRQIEVAQQMSTITTTYQKYIIKKNSQYKLLILILIILSITLFYSLYFSYHKKIELKKANNALIKSNEIRTKYITQYINRNSKYIEDTEELLHSIIKTATYQDKNTLIKKLHSSTFINDQLNDFYTDFDNTFLNIYPNFIEELNAKIKDGDKFILKNKKQLNTELRIFALIKLGITNSKDMANFLRCSLQTIYNYRSKNKNLG